MPMGYRIYLRIYWGIQNHAIVGRLHARGQFIAQRRVVQRCVHMGENRAAWFDALDPAQRQCKVCVGRMGFSLETVDNPGIDPSESRKSSFRKLLDIG